MAEVTQIVIKIGDKEIPLTLQEAKELYQALHGMFGERLTLPPIHVEPTIKPPYIVTVGSGTVTDTRTAKPFTMLTPDGTQQMWIPPVAYLGNVSDGD